MHDERTIEIRGGAVAFRVLAAGRGAPLVYFHSYYERSVWSPFLELLAGSFSVYAPAHPGVAGSTGIETLEDLLDLTLAYDELIAALGVDRAAVLWRDPASKVAREWAVGTGGDPDDIAAQVESLQRRSSMAKFAWPIPDKGLRRRLHRIAAPTLLVWGDEDHANPVVYAEEWQRRVKGAALRLLPGGHMVLHESPEAAARAVADL